MTFFVLCTITQKCSFSLFFFFQAEDGIRDADVTGVQTCALPIFGQAASDAGHFIFVVDGRGSYEVSDRTAMNVHSDTSVTFQYAGPAQFRPDPDSGARFVVSTVDVKFQAQVDPGHHTAEATLSKLGGQFHLV